MPREDLEDDSFHAPEPRMSVGVDNDIEGNRRRRLSDMRSRYSDQLRILNDLEDVQDMDEDTLESVAQELLGDYQDQDEEDLVGNQTTRNLRGLMEQEADGQLDNDSTRQSFTTDGDPTFHFQLGGDRSRLSLARSEAPLEFEDIVHDPTEIEMDVTEAFAGAEATEKEPELEDVLDQDDARDDGANWIEDAAPADSTEVPEGDMTQPQLQDPTMDMSINEGTIEISPIVIRQKAAAQPAPKVARAAPVKRAPKKMKTSRYGIEYPSVPSAVVKKLASRFSKVYGGNGKVSHDTLSALTDASDWFFERMSEDVAAFSTHAKRKKIEEADVVTLMKR